MWIAKDRAKVGPVFGSVGADLDFALYSGSSAYQTDYFTGLGIFFDTYVCCLNYKYGTAGADWPDMPTHDMRINGLGSLRCWAMERPLMIMIMITLPMSLLLARCATPSFITIIKILIRLCRRILDGEIHRPS